MGFRFRIGPFTFGRTGTRLSFWRSGTGISVPLSGKGRTSGKVGLGPLSWYFGGSRRTKDAWRDDPATERQKSFADALGIQYPENVTKGELSDMISEVRRK
jgi:hypothetical protein